MLLEEYDEELHIKNEKQISYEDGLEQGLEQGIQGFVREKLDDSVSTDLIREKLLRYYNLAPEDADRYISNVISCM